MEHSQERYEAALIRNIAEASNAILKRRALIALHNVESAHGLDFFRIAAHALYNDIMSHAMKLFERRAGVASIWYLVRCNEGAANAAAQTAVVDLVALEALSVKLQEVRDKTHFHIDKEAVFKPKTIWIDAAITGDQLGGALDAAFRVLSELHYERHGVRVTVPEYDGSDVELIIRAYKEAHPDSPIVM